MAISDAFGETTIVSLQPSIITASAALIGASVAVIAAFFLELYRRRKDTQGIAGAMYGEISAIKRMTDGSRLIESLGIIKYIVKTSNKKLAGMSAPIPNYHPVFDKISDKIGLLPTGIPEKISMSYNYVFGFRRVMSDLFTSFYDNAEFSLEVREHLITYAVSLIEDSMMLADELLPKLQEIAQPARSRWRKRWLRWAGLS